MAGKLYPLSTVPILLQNYLWTRKEMVCPRGAAVGSIAQTVAIMSGVTIVATARKLTNDIPFIQIDWLHGIEQLLMAVPAHVMAMSFRQSVQSIEKNRPLPRCATSYAPMIRKVCMLYGSIFLVGYIHKMIGAENWMNLAFLGGVIDPPTPGIDKEKLKGALSFAVWIPHWTMFIDFATQLKYMWRWGDCHNFPHWKVLTWLHLPYAVVNAIVAMNHLNRDRLAVLKLLHPIFVFVGSSATLLGSVWAVCSNRWIIQKEREQPEENERSLMDKVRADPAAIGDLIYPDWDMSYSVGSIALAMMLSYFSLYLTQ